MYFEIEKDTLSSSLNRQINDILSCFTVTTSIKFSLYLPGNQRFPYIDKELLHNELSICLNKFYPFGAKIVYIVPNSNDDHFIEVGVLVTFPKFQE